MRMKLLIAIFVLALAFNFNSYAIGSDDTNNMEQSSENANQNVLTVISSGSEIPSNTTSNVRATVPIPNQINLEQPSYFGPNPPAWNDTKGSVLPFVLFSVKEWTPEQAEALQHHKVTSVFESFLGKDKKNRTEKIKVLNGFETLRGATYTLAGYTLTHGGTNETSMDCVMQAIKNCSEGGGNVLVLLKVDGSPAVWGRTIGVGSSGGASMLSGSTAGAGGMALGYASNKTRPQTETYCHAAILTVSPETYDRLDRNGNIFEQRQSQEARQLTHGEEYVGSNRK